jgi:hypothetical protein
MAYKHAVVGAGRYDVLELLLYNLEATLQSLSAT